MSSVESNSQSNGKENKTKHKEWPGYKSEGPGDMIGKTTPLLIMELHRLQPYLEDDFPRVHVLNMPNVKIREVEIVGIIRKIYARSKFDINVDDGTGKAQILYNYANLDKVQEVRKSIDAKFSRLEKIAKIKNLGPDHMRDLEKRWMQETRNGTLGKGFKVLEYVHIIGNVHLDFGHFSTRKKDVSVENAKLCKPLIFATMIYHLSEQEYNEKLQTWISGVVRKRYQTR